MKYISDRPPRKAGTALWVILYLSVVILMGNLNAIVDSFLHPEIPYFDEEHVIVGAAAALATSFLFGALILYNRVLFRALEKQRRTEMSRSASDRKYHELFLEAKDAVFIMTRDGELVDINPAGVEMLGCKSADELMNIDFGDEVATDRAAFEALGSALNSRGFVRNHELELVRRDGGTVTVAIDAGVVRDSEGAVEAYRGIVRNITAEKILEDRLHVARQMDGVVRLAGGIAKEFNEVLTVVRGYSDLVMNELPSQSSASGNMGMIQSSAERAIRLTRELQMLSQKKPLNLQTVDISRLVRDSRDMIRRVAGNGVEVSIEPADEAHIVSADPSGIEQVLMNLVVFSRDRMDGRGEISISTGEVEVDEGMAGERGASSAGCFVTISVEDDGPQIEPEAARRIFEPFAEVEGKQLSGLGMSVAYGIVTHHEGWIESSAGDDGRTRMTVFLPLKAGAADREGDTVPDIGRLRGAGERVLLVEDEDSVREMAVKMLAENGYVVFPARDANDAFETFAREKGEIDVMFADVVLPGEDGITLAGHLLEYKSSLRVLLTSGEDTSIDDWQAIQEKGYNFVSKPYRLSRLLREMRRTFDMN